MSAPWRYWRIQKDNPGNPSVLNLESIETSAAYDDGKTVPLYILMLKWDECCHLNSRLSCPPIWPEGDGIGNYMHFCGRSALTDLAAMLIEADAIGREFFKHNGEWPAP